MSSFRSAFYKLVPSWLLEGDGERVLYSLATVKDLFVDRLVQGLYARFPGTELESALPYLGRDRKIVRGINESAESYAARLIDWLPKHRRRGNPFGLMQALADYLQADVRIRTVDRRGNWYTRDRDGTESFTWNTGNWDWDGGEAERWSRFWVIIYPTDAGEPWEVQGDFGSWVWGSGQTVGTTATPDQVATVRAIVREWKPAGTRCEWIIIAFDDASFDPTAPEPDGTWGNWTHVLAGTRTKNRLSTARYWKGVSAS